MVLSGIQNRTIKGQSPFIIPRNKKTKKHKKTKTTEEGEVPSLVGKRPPITPENQKTTGRKIIH